MTPQPVRWLFGLGAALILFGMSALAVRAADYVADPRAINSNAGLPVFRSPEGYVSYFPFETGLEPTLIGIGVALLAGAVFLAAALWRPRVY